MGERQGLEMLAWLLPMDWAVHRLAVQGLQGSLFYSELPRHG